MFKYNIPKILVSILFLTIGFSAMLGIPTVLLVKSINIQLIDISLVLLLAAMSGICLSLGMIFTIDIKQKDKPLD